MRIRILKTELWLPRPRNEVFAFFSDAQNLDILTPPWLHFQICTPTPLVVAQGTRIHYRIRWRGMPISWCTEISAWEPPRRFVDRQLRGPYLQWIHEHTFEEQNNGTLMRDQVNYAVPGWFLEPLISRLIVTPDVERIFAYRQRKMQELFCQQPGPST